MKRSTSQIHQPVVHFVREPYESIGGDKEASERKEGREKDDGDTE